jgi:hypothetical protein
MAEPIGHYLSWIGVWTGTGEAQAGMETLIRVEMFPAAAGTGLGFHFEAYDLQATRLYHGVRAVVAAAPSGALRAIAWSSIHGSLLLEQTPDDEGVLALTGTSRTGNQISVTFVEETPDQLLFTAFWRPPNARTDDDRPRMTCVIRRVTPVKFDPPPTSQPPA